VEQDKRQTSINVHAVEKVQDQDTPAQDPKVAAFRPQPQQSGPQSSGYNNYNNRGNHSRGQNSYRGNSGSGNRQTQNKGSNASRNGKFCVYCKILNHTQEECRKRMNDNKPCVNGKGQLYWPKINNIETNSANNDSNNGVGSVFQSRAS
jgi:hypothetical protein